MRRMLGISMLVACHHVSGSAVRIEPLPETTPATSVAIPTTPRDMLRIPSADGSFSLAYPPSTFVKAQALGTRIELVSDISEPPFGLGQSGDSVYTLTLTKLGKTPIEQMKTILDASTFQKIFRSGAAASFAPDEGFVDREPDGYRVSMGVEGVGDEIHVFTTGDGTTWQLDCNFCCGLVAKPRMTREQQLALCGAIMHAFEQERLTTSGRP